MYYKKCQLCARLCGVDRTRGNIGFCAQTSDVKIARASLHAWEEPIISGTRGSGTIFFSGCSLGCIYCQNKEISRGGFGKTVSTERLSEIMLELEMRGAHNINFVTPTHFAPSVVSAVAMARSQGMKIPTVYNTGSYETPETVRMLSDTVDVFLPDLKYYKAKTAKEYSSAQDLPSVSRAAIDEMVKLRPECVIGDDGLIKKGVVVRILLLPMHVAEAKLNVKYLYDKYGDAVYVSLMSQYTPPKNMKAPLDRRVTSAEYRELVEYAANLGIKNAFIQDGGSASESFIPPFDLSGV